MERLPDDIVADILSRLPVKNLQQIKCVCKPWNTTISDPKFAELQLQQSHSNNNGNNFNKILVFLGNLAPVSLDFESDDEEFTETKLDSIFGDKRFGGNPYIKCLGYCHGLFCIRRGRELLVWNPSIRQYRVLPDDKYSQESLFHLVYDFLSKTKVVYDFGFDSVSNDYKVFRGFKDKSDKFVWEVFALKTDYWRRIETFSYSWHLYQSPTSKCFLNGSLHWIDKLTNYPGIRTFVAFSLADEKFLEGALPDVDGVNGANFTEIIGFDGCLCVYRPDIVKAGTEFWIMKEYMVRASWTKLTTVLWDTIPTFSPIYLIPLCYSRNGDLLLDIDGEGVVKYNINEKICTNKAFSFEVSSGDLKFNASLQAFAYVESLVSPNCDLWTHGARQVVG